MSIDVLVVGQGLAGSLLAWELMQQQLRVMVIDTGDENASQVAAGLINPVTGQRLVKTFGVEAYLPAALDCYEQLRIQFGFSFFVPLPMLRIFRSFREREIAAKRLLDSDYRIFLKSHDDSAEIISPFGLIEQRKTGYLRTTLLLESLRDYFLQNGAYRRTRMDYREIQFKPCLQWRDLQPEHIVFCEGYQALNNPWFGRLPFQPVKGQILTCKTTAVVPQRILNFGYWLIPSISDGFKVGATFEPGVFDTQVNAEATQRLLQRLSEICPALQPVDIVSGQAGIRPATLDKQPFVGHHPRYSNLHIFNGFGAKGSLTIPWHAQRLVSALKRRLPLPEFCSIQRYDETYFLD
ncbi:MAG: NAD(P)/FAD-dependent oxidoreductase [Gammaproteobacteria bacterium]